jgi:hypothetical protein
MKMSKYCDYEKDDFYSCINNDDELLDHIYESFFPHVKSKREYRKKLQLNKIELVKQIEFYKDCGEIGMFQTDMELSEDDVKEISDKYGLYYILSVEDGCFHFEFKERR